MHTHGFMDDRMTLHNVNVYTLGSTALHAVCMTG
jgi:hypothetical protein